MRNKCGNLPKRKRTVNYSGLSALVLRVETWLCDPKLKCVIGSNTKRLGYSRKKSYPKCVQYGSLKNGPSVLYCIRGYTASMARTTGL